MKDIKTASKEQIQIKTGVDLDHDGRDDIKVNVTETSLHGWNPLADTHVKKRQAANQNYLKNVEYMQKPRFFPPGSSTDGAPGKTSNLANNIFPCCEKNMNFRALQS